MAKSIEAGEHPLYKVFSSDYEFHVPDYQRPYSWGPEQALTLLTDIRESAAADPKAPYFLGSIVLVKKDGEAKSDVIDGQQRLTTLALLMALIGHLTDDPQVKREVETYLVEPGMKLLGQASVPRLTLRPRDADFFREHVQERDGIGMLLSLQNPDNDARRLLHENALALHDGRSNARGKDAEIPGGGLGAATPNQLVELLTYMLTQTYLVVVSTPDLGSAHRIFSVMNSRGMDLSAPDIFKSRVIGDLPEARRTEYARKWEDAEEDLGRDDFADMFLHIRLIKSRMRARRELLLEFQEQVLKEYLPDRAAAFVDEVVDPYADAYEIIRDRSFQADSGASQVNAWLRRLNQLDNNDWKPPALWAFHHHGKDAQWLAAFLKRLESLGASMLLRRVYSTPRVQRYVELLQQLDDGHGVESVAFDLDPMERGASIAALQSDIYLVKPVSRYVLLRLDDVLAGDAGVTYEHRIVTIEHVLPQTPREDSEWCRDFTEEQRAYWTHKLANLVLLNRRKNSGAQNYDFEDKKSKYFGKDSVSRFVITTEVIGAEEWTPEVLERRQDQKVDLLAAEWGWK